MRGKQGPVKHLKREGLVVVKKQEAEVVEEGGSKLVRLGRNLRKEGKREERDDLRLREGEDLGSSVWRRLILEVVVVVGEVVIRALGGRRRRRRKDLGRESKDQREGRTCPKTQLDLLLVEVEEPEKGREGRWEGERRELRWRMLEEEGGIQGGEPSPLNVQKIKLELGRGREEGARFENKHPGRRQGLPKAETDFGRQHTYSYGKFSLPRR